MSSHGGPTVAVKLFIDKGKKTVLFAESDKDFVDILFSFLTLPLGTIVRLFNKQSQIGCLDELYRSVEGLSEDHFQTRDCRAMLLRPANAAAVHCGRLKVKVDDADQTAIYVCNNCSAGYFSPVRDVSCKCGRIMYGIKRLPDNSAAGTGDSTVDGIFSRGGSKFIVTDDLQVAPSSTTLMFSLIDRLGLQEQLNIKEEVLQLNSNKIISLLGRALVSKQPLTGLYFDVPSAPNGASFCCENLLKPQAIVVDPKFTPIKIRVVQTKDNSSVLYAEVNQDLVDLLFGLLCIPVGSIVKTYGQLSPNGCLHNVYNSLSVAGCVKQECRGLLLSPKLAPFFGCSSNVLQVEELPIRQHYVPHYACELNPKSPNRGCETSYRAYVNQGSINFMVTDGLRIVDFSLAKSLQAIRAAKVPKGELVEKELVLDKTKVRIIKSRELARSSLLFNLLLCSQRLTVCWHYQVLKILGAAVATRNALSSVLLPTPKKNAATTSTEATTASGLQLRRSARLRKPSQPGEE
ncbi:hypothetical protein CFC21_008443 [Triticum aestivum]|uniref:DUF674 domain-containing protein n=2 Tax=Triticum aestivum TaxID=4565 RepID=A0A3B5Z2F0_WHEAT|nr:hypothetical protein CFC21_008443 [Triticum aestivum]